MSHRVAIFLALLPFICAPCMGAELFYMDHDSFTEKYVGPVGPLVFSGDIEPGDYDHLLSKILDDENRFLSQNKILLASDGGDVAEAIKIGKLIRALFSEVVVGTQTGRCVSACFFIYASAHQRATEGERLLGINRPFIADSPAAATTGTVTTTTRTTVSAAASEIDSSVAESNSLVQVRAFLAENDVPAYLIDEMFRHASDDAYWLTVDDEKKLGYRSKALSGYLAAKCAWDDTVEREVFAGKRPMGELTQMWKCRADTTRPDAHKALLTASKEKSARDKSQAAKGFSANH